jgi:hypothetical protein
MEESVGVGPVTEGDKVLVVVRVGVGVRVTEVHDSVAVLRDSETLGVAVRVSDGVTGTVSVGDTLWLRLILPVGVGVEVAVGVTGGLSDSVMLWLRETEGLGGEMDSERGSVGEMVKVRDELRGTVMLRVRVPVPVGVCEEVVETAGE